MKHMLCLLLLLCFAIPVEAVTLYVDVPEEAWYAESVDYVTDQQLMMGTGNGAFSPDVITNRSMVVTVLWRHAGKPGDGFHMMPYPDEVKNQFYDIFAKEWGMKNDIIEGYPIIPDQSGGAQNVPETGYFENFKGENPVTREELACFLYRYAKYAGADVSGSASLEGFADAASVSDWAEVALGWCVAEGILQGTPAGDSLNLAPADHATRAEVAAMLMRYCQMIGQ